MKLFKTIESCIVVAVLLALIFTHNISAQTGESKGPTVWSPADNSFKVTIPFDPKEIKEEVQDEATSGYKSLRLFTAKRNDVGFLIAVIELTDAEKRQTPKQKFGGLQLFIGGDDDHEFTETFTKKDGRVAKEILYSKKPNKGLMIDARDRIYVLGFFTKERADLEKSAARDFFSSFRLLKTTKW